MKEKEKINAIRAEVQNYIDAAHKAHTNITEGNFAHLLSFIDSLQEEPVDKCKNCNNVKGCITCVDGDQWAHYEEPISKELEEASKEWLAPQLDKSYAAYGETKQMELTHFDGYAMLDAIEFGAKWGKNQAMAEIKAQSMALAHGCPEESKNEDLEMAAEQLAENARKHKTETSSPFFCQTDYKQGVIDGAKWQKEEMMSKAIRGRVSVNVESNYHSLIYGCWDMDNALINYNEGDKVKVIVIKED